VTLNGSPLGLAGDEVEVGQTAPDFAAITNDLVEFRLSSLKNKKALVLSAVPSLDTPVCDIETRRFNQEAAALGDDVQIVTISMDLPFAQKRWCGAAGIDKVVVVSDHRDASFGKAYGVLIGGLRLLARAVFVIDRQGKIRHAQIVPEIANEPDYGAVLDAVREAIGPDRHLTDK
jgi:thiol peroxidase